jgi:tetratricopeptide (TPR) repeat protein/transcriptional regulator with XRE-family HTH domain
VSDENSPHAGNDVLDLADGRVRLDPELLKKLRRQHGYSQSMLADFARQQGRPVSIASIKRAELGAPVLYRTALQLAALLNIEVSDLITEQGKAFATEAAPESANAQPMSNTDFALVGRVAEKRQFQTILLDLQRERSGKVVYLRGAAGMGKSRLLADLREFASQAGFHHVGVQIPPGLTAGSSNFLTQAIFENLKLPADMPDKHAANDLLRQKLRQRDLDDALAMPFSAMLGLPQATEHLPIYQAMSHDTRLRKFSQALMALIKQQTQVKPVIIMMEDLHWADDRLLDIAAPMIFATRHLPLAWVLTSRIEKDPLDSKIRPYLANLPIHIFEIAPLTAQEAQALAQQATAVDPARRKECMEQAQGNPLFLTQLLLNADATSLPGSLSDLVQSKLMQLSAIDKKAVEIAASAGPEFPLKLLRSLLGEPAYVPSEPLSLHIFRACGVGTYAFVHDLILRGIYSGIAKSERQKIHESIARYYESTDKRLFALFLDRAQHPEAAAALLATIEELCARYLYDEALDLSRRYSKISYGAIDKHKINLLQGGIFSAMGRTKDARICFEEALRHAPDLSAQLPAVVGLARAMNVLDDLQAEEQLLSEYIDKARDIDDAVHLGQLYHLKGNLFFPRGDHEESRKLHTAARQQARKAKDGKTEALAFSGLGDSYYAQGRMLTASQTFQRCLELCEQFSLADVEASNRFMLATTRLYLNETSGALKDAMASAELASRVGNRRAEIVSRLTAGWLHLSLGKTNDAQVQFHGALGTARAIGAARFEPFLLEGLARTLFVKGDVDSALATIRDAWRMVERQKIHRFIGPWILGTQALIEPGEVEKNLAIKAGLSIIDAGCVAHNHYRFFVAAAEAKIVDKDAATASRFADRLEAFTSAEPCPWADHHVQLIRARVDALLHPFSNQPQAVNQLIENGILHGIAYASPLLHEMLGPRH